MLIKGDFLKGKLFILQIKNDHRIDDHFTNSILNLLIPPDALYRLTVFSYNSLA
jgi:hypothetical protein